MSINWGGLSTKTIDEMYRDALEFFSTDSNRHLTNGRQTYAQEIKHHLEVIEERVRRLQNAANALMKVSGANKRKAGIRVVVDGETFVSIRHACDALGCHKSTINRMLRDGEAKRA